MKNPADEDVIFLRLIEDDVLPLFQAPDAGVNQVAGSAQSRRVSQSLEALRQLFKIYLCLAFAPGVHGVVEYVCEIRDARGT